MNAGGRLHPVPPDRHFGFDYWTWNGSMKFMSQRIRIQLKSIWMNSLELIRTQLKGVKIKGRGRVDTLLLGPVGLELWDLNLLDSNLLDLDLFDLDLLDLELLDLELLDLDLLEVDSVYVDLVEVYLGGGRFGRGGLVGGGLVGG